MNAHADMLIVVDTTDLTHHGHLPLSCYGCVKFAGF